MYVYIYIYIYSIMNWKFESFLSNTLQIIYA